MQFINHCFGGTLKDAQTPHVNVLHGVELCSDSKMSDCPQNAVVNSYHSYVIDKLGTELNPIYLAEDHTIEAFIHTKHRLIGLMWHPERYDCIQDIDALLISKLMTPGEII